MPAMNNWSWKPGEKSEESAKSEAKTEPVYSLTEEILFGLYKIARSKSVKRKAAQSLVDWYLKKRSWSEKQLAFAQSLIAEYSAGKGVKIPEPQKKKGKAGKPKWLKRKISEERAARALDKQAIQSSPI